VVKPVAVRGIPANRNYAIIGAADIIIHF